MKRLTVDAIGVGLAVVLGVAIVVVIMLVCR